MASKNYVFFLVVTLLSFAVLSGCAVSTNENRGGGVVSPKPHNGYRGELFAEAFSSSKISSAASKACEPFGGLVPGSLRRIKVDGLRAINEPVGDYYEYKCGHGVKRKREPNYQSTTPQRVQPSQAPARNVSVDEVKRKCKELGFVEGTPEFADCGLKLMQ